jgi:hypothetical protein
MMILPFISLLGLWSCGKSQSLEKDSRIQFLHIRQPVSSPTLDSRDYFFRFAVDGISESNIQDAFLGNTTLSDSFQVVLLGCKPDASFQFSDMEDFTLDSLRRKGIMAKADTSWVDQKPRTCVLLKEVHGLPTPTTYHPHIDDSKWDFFDKDGAEIDLGDESKKPFRDSLKKLALFCASPAILVRQLAKDLKSLKTISGASSDTWLGFLTGFFSSTPTYTLSKQPVNPWKALSGGAGFVWAGMSLTMCVQEAHTFRESPKVSLFYQAQKAYLSWLTEVWKKTFETMKQQNPKAFKKYTRALAFDQDYQLAGRLILPYFIATSIHKKFTHPLKVPYPNLTYLFSQFFGPYGDSDLYSLYRLSGHQPSF